MMPDTEMLRSKSTDIITLLQNMEKEFRKAFEIQSIQLQTLAYRMDTQATKVAKMSHDIREALHIAQKAKSKGKMIRETDGR
jgi:hypothetical protein